MSQQTTQIRIDSSEDKLTIKSRVDRAGVVAKLTPSSALFQAQPALQLSGAAVLAAGADLSAADSAVLAAEAQLATARKSRDAKLTTFDSALGVYIANTEHLAASPQDAVSLGLKVAEKSTYALVPPSEVQATFDPTTGVVRIQMKAAPGMRACVVETSTDPAGPATWKRLEGIGARRTLSGLAPGMYWVRAASARAQERSEFTSPVAFVVK